jgi:hypothetical protein
LAISHTGIRLVFVGSFRQADCYQDNQAQQGIAEAVVRTLSVVGRLAVDSVDSM